MLKSSLGQAAFRIRGFLILGCNQLRVVNTVNGARSVESVDMETADAESA